MYKMLVVDDEEIAVRGIVDGIDWSDLAIERIFIAYDAIEAKQIFEKESIDLMISDIEMPGENGIELLNWVNEHYPDTETIFLTGHADFRFAQQAVHLSSFDYLLKPIDHDVLKRCVKKALHMLDERRREDAFHQLYAFYYEQWNRQLPLLVDRFWQDVISQRIPISDQLESTLSLYQLELSVQSHILPVLISVEQWTKDWSARDEDILTYALMNAANEMILKENPGHIISFQNGMLFALFYDPTKESLESVEWLTERCDEYIKKCKQFLYCTLSCYIGEAVAFKDLPVKIEELTLLERMNVCQTGSVFTKDAFHVIDEPAIDIPNWQQWKAFIEQGKKKDLYSGIESLFARLEENNVGYNYLIHYYFGFVHMVFQALDQRGFTPGDVYTPQDWKEGEQAVKSLDALRRWTLQFVNKTIDFLSARGKVYSTSVLEVQRYIQQNLHQELNRDTIAAHVYLNSAYLSRLFRKEMGKSLSEYIAELRIEKAKNQLVKTNMKISDIAVSVGYVHFSHFSQFFKKMTGFTPLEYRKQYQQIHH